MRKLKTYDNGGPKVKQRRGVRKNYDNQTWTPSGLQFPTSVSSHLMTTEYIPGRGWVSFPSLFQDSKPYADDQQNWVDMSEEEDWMKIYEEADRRGEVYDFGEDKEAALAFGEGSWKDQLPDEYIDVELTDEEAEKYKAGGYILEELDDGGEDDKKKKSRKENRKENEQQVANWANRSSYFEHRSDGTPITIEDKVNKFLQSLEDQRARDEAAGTDIISTSGYKYGNWKDRRKYKKFIKSTMDDIHAEAEHQYLYKNDPTYRGKYNLATKEKTKKYKNPNYVFDDPKTKVNEELLYLTKADADPEFTPESKYLYQFADVDVAQNAGAQKTLNKRRNKAKMMNHIFAELQGYGELPSGYGDEAWGEYVTAYENATKKAKNILAYEKAAKDVKKGRLSTHDFHALYRKRGWAEYDPKNVKEDVKGLWKIQMELIDEKKRQKFADELNMGAHLSGIPAAMNIIDNPIETGKDVLYTAADIAYQPVQPIVSAVTGNDKNLVTGQEMFANTDGVWDVAAVAPYAIGAYGQAKNLINLGRGSKTATATKVKPAAEYKAQNVVKGKNVSGNTPLSKSQIEDIIKERKSYLNSNEYMKRRIAQTGETEAQVRASVTQYSDDLDNVEIYFHDKPGAAGQYFPKQKNSWLERKIFGQPKYTNPTINIYNQGSPERLRNVLTHELDHLASPVGRNTSFKYPKVKSEGKYLNLTEEQHAAKNQLDRTIREDLKIKNYDPITESQFNKWQTTNPGYQRLKNPVEHGFDHVDDFVTGFQNKGGNKTQLLDFLNKGYATVPLTLGAGYSITQKDGGFILELDEEAAKRFAEGGYILEELEEGGEDDDLITYKNNKNLIDSVANWDMQSDVDISSDYNDQIKARLLTGNYGFNLKTGELVKLGKSQQTKVTDKEALETIGDLTETRRDDARQELMDDYTANRKLVSIDKAYEWNPSFVIKDEYGRDINTQDFAGKQVYMTDAEHEAYKKARIDHNAPIAQQQMNTAFSIPAAFTPAGMGIMGMQGAAHMTQDVPELIENPSWSNAGKVFVDALMVSPLILPSAISTAKNIKNVKLPYPKMDLNKLGSYPIPKEALPTTVKGTKDYIKNFKPKQTLQLESSDMKFDRVLKDMTRQDTPTLARNFSGVEFDKNLLGLKNENRVLGDYGEIYGRRTKHFSGTGAGAHIGGMNAGYNTTFLGNIDDIKKASGSHLREISPTDTYFYNSDNVFKLTNKGVYLTSDPATYQRLYNAGKTVKFEPNLMDGSHSNLSKYIGDDASILKSFDSYITNPSNRGSLMPTVYKNKTTAFPSSMNSSAAHSYDILADLETLERLPLFNQFITKNKLTGNTKLSSYMTKAGELGPGEFATDYTYFNQWINLPKKVREAELQKVKNFYESNVKTGKLSESALGIRYENNLKQYQTDYKKIIDQLEDLHKNAGPGLKYKKGGSIEAELTDEEVEQYKARGYVLEELEHGGSHEGDPPNNLTYAERKQAYDDSLTLYNYSRNRLDLQRELEEFPPQGNMTEDEYDRYLAKTAPEKLKLFVNSALAGTNVNAIKRLTKLNNASPGYAGNTLDIPAGYDKYLSRRFYTFDKPKVPIRKPTMKEAYETVDKEKYPTFEDFEYAAEFYKEHGENPDPSDLPSNRLPAPPPPNYEIEDIEPEVEIEKLDVIEPELISNDTELPDIIERDEVEGVDYKRKFGVWSEDKAQKDAKLKTFFKYAVPEFFNPKKSRVSQYYRTPKRIRAGFYNEPIEEEQLYPEGFVPMFEMGGGKKKGYRRVYEDGTGSTEFGRRKEVDVYRPFTGVGKTLVKDITYKTDDSPRVKITEREVTRRKKDGSMKSYKKIVRKNGKLVKEATTKKIKYDKGGPVGSLQNWANQQYDIWQGLDENSAEGRNLAGGYFSLIGDNYNLGILNQGKSVPHWSAATVSSGVMASLGAKNKAESQALGFNPTASHSGYVRDAFKTLNNPKYQYNKYVPTKVDVGDFEVGDILVQGRSGTKNWSYDDFANAQDSYESHGDIIVDKGSDDKGDYVILAGGNLSNTYKNRKVYLDKLGSQYKVKLKDTQNFYNVGEDVTVDEKQSSIYPNNFDWDNDNNQRMVSDYEEERLPPIAQYNSNLIASGPSPLFGEDTLGIGYIPYTYQFPDYLGPQEEETSQYIPSEDMVIGNTTEEKKDEEEKEEVTDPKVNVTKEFTKEQIDQKRSELPLFMQNTLSDEDIKNLFDESKSKPISEDNEIYKYEKDTFIKANEDIRKNQDEGKVWISYNDPNPPLKTEGWNNAQAYKEELKERYGKVTQHNIYSVLAGFEDDPEYAEGYLQLGEVYGDGSNKYGEWVTEDQISESLATEVTPQDYWMYDPVMQNSGRAMPWYPELNFIGGWRTVLGNLAWEALLGPTASGSGMGDFWRTNLAGNILKGTGDVIGAGAEFAGDAWDNLSSFIKTLSPPKPGEKGWKEYQEAKEYQREADRNYQTRKKIMQSLANPNYSPPQTMSFQDGGSIPKAQDGRVVSKLWKDVTGTPWSQAKAQGLTDGSYAQNIALRKRLLSGEFGEVTASSPSSGFDYDAYDARVKRFIDKGYTLDDLVRIRMGTRSGLSSRFPELVGKKTEVVELDEKEAEELKKEGRVVEEASESEEVTIPTTKKAFSILKQRLNFNDRATRTFSDMFSSQTPNPLAFDFRPETVKEKERLDRQKAIFDISANYYKRKAKEAEAEALRQEEEKARIEQEKIEQLQEIGEGLSKADWKGLGNVLLNEASVSLQPLASSFYDVGSNLANFYQNMTKEVEPEEVELDEQEVQNLEDQGYVVEEVPPFEELYDPYDPKNFYSRYYKELELDQSQDALKPEYFGYRKPLNLFGEDPDAEYEQWKAETFKAPRRPKSMLSKIVDEVGEYVDAAKGLPKKIYDGVSKEVDEFSKSAVKVLKDLDEGLDIGDSDYFRQDLDLTVDLVQSVLNKDKERFLENKYGQEIGFKILDQYDNPDKYTIPWSELISVVGDSGSLNENINFLRRKLEKEGRISTPEEKLKPVEEKVIEVQPEPETFTERIGDVKDYYLPQYKLLAYRNQWDNNKGFVYVTAPTKQHRKSSDRYENVIGVAHFLLDASVDPQHPYNHRNNISYIKKAKANNEWIPTFKTWSNNQVILKYKKPEDIEEGDVVSAPLRQYKFSEINWGKTKTPRGFAPTIKEVTLNDGQGTHLLFKNRGSYSRFSGGSVVFIFEDEYGNTIVRDFAGSLDSIKKEGQSITKNYNLKPGELTLGYHDVGSFSAKPKANDNNVITADQWGDYNDNGWTGGALLIPTSQPTLDYMERMFPNTYNK